MRLHHTAMGRHLPYGITQCYLPPDTSKPPRFTLASKPVLDLPTPEGWKADLGYPAIHLTGVEPATSQSQVRRPNHCTTTALPSNPIVERTHVRSIILQTLYGRSVDDETRCRVLFSTCTQLESS